MKCDLPGLYVQPRGGVKGLRDGKIQLKFSVFCSSLFKFVFVFFYSALLCLLCHIYCTHAVFVIFLYLLVLRSYALHISVAVSFLWPQTQKCYFALLQQFAQSCGCRKTNTKVITPTNSSGSKQRDEPITIASNYLLLKAREKSRVQGAIGFGFASHWLKNCANEVLIGVR